MKATRQTMTSEMCSVLWLHCQALGAVEGMRMAAEARRQILAGNGDAFAIGWAVTAYNQIPAAARKIHLAAYRASLPN